MRRSPATQAAPPAPSLALRAPSRSIARTLAGARWTDGRLILVLVEHDRASIVPATFEALTFARTLGDPVHALVIGAAGRRGRRRARSLRCRRWCTSPTTSCSPTTARRRGATRVAEAVRTLAPDAVVATGTDRRQRGARPRRGAPRRAVRRQLHRRRRRRARVGGSADAAALGRLAARGRRLDGRRQARHRRPSRGRRRCRPPPVHGRHRSRPSLDPGPGAPARSSGRVEREAGVTLATAPRGRRRWARRRLGRRVRPAARSSPPRSAASSAARGRSPTTAGATTPTRSARPAPASRPTSTSRAASPARSSTGSARWRRRSIIAINTDPEANMVTKADYAVIGDLHAGRAGDHRRDPPPALRRLTCLRYGLAASVWATNSSKAASSGNSVSEHVAVIQERVGLPYGEHDRRAGVDRRAEARVLLDDAGVALRNDASGGVDDDGRLEPGVREDSDGVGVGHTDQVVGHHLGGARLRRWWSRDRVAGGVAVEDRRDGGHEAGIVRLHDRHLRIGDAVAGQQLSRLHDHELLQLGVGLEVGCRQHDHDSAGRSPRRASRGRLASTASVRRAPTPSRAPGRSTNRRPRYRRRCRRCRRRRAATRLPPGRTRTVRSGRSVPPHPARWWRGRRPPGRSHPPHR